MDNIFENFTISIVKLNKLIQKIKLYEMKKYGLKSIDVMCIYYLDKYDEGLTASNIVKLTLEDKAAISRALNLLKTKGIVEYDSKKYNANIHLTNEGKKLAKQMEEKVDKAVNAIKFFTDEERQSFNKSINILIENIETYYDNLIKDK